MRTQSAQTDEARRRAELSEAGTRVAREIDALEKDQQRELDALRKRREALNVNFAGAPWERTAAERAIANEEQRVRDAYQVRIGEVRARVSQPAAAGGAVR